MQCGRPQGRPIAIISRNLEIDRIEKLPPLEDGKVKYDGNRTVLLLKMCLLQHH